MFTTEHYERSDSIGELAKALCRAQTKMSGAKKDSTNPHFRSKYADLASVRDACLEALNAAGLAVLQPPASRDGELVSVATILAHESGEWLSSTLTLRPVKADPQGVGSAITYARRYALAGMVGVAPEDDDGNAAAGHSTDSTADPRQTTTPEVKPTTKDDLVEYDTSHEKDGEVYVRSVTEKTLRSGKIKWVVVLSTGEEAETFKPDIADDARAARELGAPVTYRLGAASDPKYAPWLNSIQAVQGAPKVATPPDPGQDIGSAFLDDGGESEAIHAQYDQDETPF